MDVIPDSHGKYPYGIHRFGEVLVEDSEFSSVTLLNNALRLRAGEPKPSNERRLNFSNPWVSITSPLLSITSLPCVPKKVGVQFSSCFLIQLRFRSSPFSLCVPNPGSPSFPRAVATTPASPRRCIHAQRNAMNASAHQCKHTKTNARERTLTNANEVWRMQTHAGARKRIKRVAREILRWYHPASIQNGIFVSI